jgi:fibronectin type 3 domain-containing protein
MKGDRIICQLIAAVCLCAALTFADTPPLHVDGKYFKDPSGNIVILRGVAMIHTPDMDTTRPGHEFMIDNVTTAANGWYARIIRIGVRVEAYMNNPANIVNNYLKPSVDYCTSKGLYCIIDWHPITDARTYDSQTRQFWNHVAPIFANYDNVLYEVFNEHSVDTSWAVWKSVAQPWVDIIRSHAPNNIVLIGGPFYSQHIQGAATDPFNGSNLAYVAHVYPGGWYPQGWDGNIGVVADVHPVIVTEWGYNPSGDSVTLGTRSNFGIPFQNWAEGKGVSWIAWVSDYAWGPPMFNSNWTPNDFGSFAKDWLFNKRNSNQPSEGATFTSSATATPSTVGAGSTTTINATINCTAGALSSGIVDLEVYNAGGTRVGQQYWTGQNFTAGQSTNYIWNWSTTNTGTYTVKIGVFTSGWASNPHWNAGATTITVSSPTPPTPTGLSAAAVSACQINLTWSPSSGATSYNVKRGTASGGPYTTIASGVTGTGYNDTGRASGTTYYYVVSAVNAAGESANSAQASATTFSGPGAPSGLNATAASSTQINLAWTDNATTEDGFKIERSTDNVSFTQVATAGANVTTYANSGLAGGTTYYYRVRAYDVCGNNSAYSATDSATTMPAAPSGLTASPGHEQVSLSWSAATGATSYNVKRSTTSGGPYTTVASGITGTSYLNNGLVNGTAYYFVVSAVNGSGEGPNSAQASTTPSAPSFSSSASVTPNTVAKGASTTVSISITCNSGALYNGLVDLEIYNSAGTRVGQTYWTNQNFAAGQTTPYTWNWSTTNTGTYTVKVGVFSAAWADTLNWNNAATTFTVVTTAIRLNSGGAATGWFAADANYSGGTAASTTNTIDISAVTNPAPAAVYQTERYGAFTYTVGGLTAGATYTVRLHFAEIYWTATGQRKFHVNINGTRVLTDFDIVAAAGAARKATLRQFTATANASGQIVIQYLTGSVNNPQSSGIEIIR